MPRLLRPAGLLLLAAALPFAGAALYDLTAPVPAAPAAPTTAPAATLPRLRPALWLVAPSSTSSAPPVYAA